MLLVLPHILSHYRNWWMKLDVSVVCQSRRRETQQLTGMKEICICDYGGRRKTFRKTIIASCKTRRKNEEEKKDR